MIKKICIFLLCFLFASMTFAADPSSEVLSDTKLTLQSLLNKIQSNQNKIKDMYAETTTTITSSIAMPGTKTKGPQKMVQKGKMWTKGQDKSKIEMLSPMKQVTITNGDKMAIINPQTGQKMVQDLSKVRGPRSKVQGQEMDLQKAMEYFDLSLKQTEDGDYVITGVPKKKNKFLGKMEFYVDSTRWVPVKILMYGAKNKLLSRSVIEYEKISKVWVPVKNRSNVNTPAGRMEVEMEFKNIKINKGIKDKEFEI